MSRETKIQTVAALIAAILGVLRMLGVTQVENVTEDTIIGIATAIVVVVTWAYASHYKNNDFTEEACKGTGYTRWLKMMKKGDTFGENLESLEEVEEDGKNI